MRVSPVPVEAILDWREAYRREMNCQIVHDSWHARGFTQSFLLELEGEIVGYGSVGAPPGEAKDIVKEFFVRRAYRGSAPSLFRRLLDVSGARSIEAQTNDVLLSLMLHDFARDLTSDTLLFSDAVKTKIASVAALEPLSPEDRATVFEHTVEPVGEWGLTFDGRVVATGGGFDHYNPPYVDLFMEVHEPYRQRGFGSYLVQELKRICHENGRIPGARCHKKNEASRRTLQRAGMFPCARIIRGVVG